MRLSPEVRALADALDQAAARCEEAARSPDGTLPTAADRREGALTRFSRVQWRDAGTASVLREVADAVRSGSLSPLRTRSWLVARQVECDVAADESMARLGRASGPDREAAVAHSAFVLGRAKGIKVASELCQPQADAVR